MFAIVIWMLCLSTATAAVADEMLQESPDMIVLPSDDAAWQKIKGTEFRVDLHLGECQAKIILPAGKRVAIIPHPSDQWRCTWSLGDPTPVGWRGDLTQPVGMTKQLQIKAYPMGGAKNGPVQIDKDKVKAAWIDVADLPGMIWTGPGMISFRGLMPAAKGYGEGVIRVKIVPQPALAVAKRANP